MKNIFRAFLAAVALFAAMTTMWDERLATRQSP